MLKLLGGNMASDARKIRTKNLLRQANRKSDRRILVGCLMTHPRKTEQYKISIN